MARATTATTSVERLARYLFDNALDAPVAAEVHGWLAESARFRTFVEAHRDKIRKKLRGAADLEARRDVRAELNVARVLLADHGIELEFEAYGARNPGPDFTVRFRGERLFNLEVTRSRRRPQALGGGRPLVAKLRQLPPSVPNAVLVAIEGEDAAGVDVAGAMRALRSRADAKDESFFARNGFSGTRDFYQRYMRLGAVFVWCESGVGDARAAAWTNPAARIGVPPRALTSCLTRLRAG
jgi:hypothetical protein